MVPSEVVASEEAQVEACLPARQHGSHSGKLTTGLPAPPDEMKVNSFRQIGKRGSVSAVYLN